jgi:hypothetical protein
MRYKSIPRDVRDDVHRLDIVSSVLCKASMHAGRRDVTCDIVLKYAAPLRAVRSFKAASWQGNGQPY